MWSRLWHWSVLAFSVIGALVAVRLGLAAWGLAEETPDDRLVWWLMAGGCAVLVLAFARETWWRIARLRATPTAPAAPMVEPAPEPPPATMAPSAAKSAAEPTPKRAAKRSGKKRGRSRGSKR